MLPLQAFEMADRIYRTQGLELGMDKDDIRLVSLAGPISGYAVANNRGSPGQPTIHRSGPRGHVKRRRAVSYAFGFRFVRMSFTSQVVLRRVLMCDTLYHVFFVVISHIGARVPSFTDNHFLNR